MYFEHLTMRDGLSQSTVKGILQDSQGYLWLATESGLDRYDGNSIRVYRRERGNPHALASDYIWTIAEDAHADLWLATIGGGVARWQRAHRPISAVPARPGPGGLARQRRGAHAAHRSARAASGWARSITAWICSIPSPATPVTSVTATAIRVHCPPMRVFALYADHAAASGSAPTAGLSRYEPATGGFVNYGRSADGAGLSDLQVRAIREDHTGALWIGTMRGGLDRLEPGTGRVTVFRHDPPTRTP